MAKMQIIEKMSDERFGRICDAGVSLVDELKTLLAKHNLNHGDAVSVLAIASGGVLITGEASADDYMQSLHSSCGLWYVDEETGSGLAGATFAPHIQPEAFNGTMEPGEN